MYEEIRKLEQKLEKDKMLRIVFLFSGQMIYLPKDRWELDRRNREIKQAWKNHKIKELAELYNLDESSVYRILKYGRNSPPNLKNAP